MLLRASSKANDLNVGLSCAVGEPIVSDIAHGQLLLEFTEKANEYPPEVKNISEEINKRFELEMKELGYLK